MSKKSAIRSGEAGEKVVSAFLSSVLETHYLINNLILLGHNGISHQIDHIYICEHGVFVLETKNYFGELKGREEDDYWTQTYTNKKRIITKNIFNPLKQNKSHLKAVKNVIGQEIPLHGFIVLVQNNEQQIDLFNVTSPAHLLERIKLLTPETLLTNDRMAALQQLILNAEADVSDIDHVENLKTATQLRKAHQEKIRKAIETRICPFCQGDLKLNKMTLVCVNCLKEIKV